MPSSKAHRLTHSKPGYYTPPGRPICVPGLRLPQPEAFGTRHRAGVSAAAGHAALGPRAGSGEARVRDEECKLLRQGAQLWGRLVVHVFDRGYESLVWLGALSAFAVRFVLRWRHDDRLVDAQGQTRLAWKMVQGKRAWGKGRPLWDAKGRNPVQASVLACPVRHPDFPQWPLWLVVGRRQGGTPWYPPRPMSRSGPRSKPGPWFWPMPVGGRSNSPGAPVRASWAGLAHACGGGKSASNRFRIATLGYAFLLHLLSPAFGPLRLWLLRYAAHSYWSACSTRP